MARSKVESYLGFARRAGQLTAGVNAVKTLKRAGVLVLSPDAAPNTVREAEKLADKFSCPLVVADTPLEELIGKENCKLVAVKEGELAAAIQKNADESYIKNPGGCKDI